MLKDANRNEHQTRKTDVFWHKNRKTDLKNSQTRKPKIPMPPLCRSGSKDICTLQHGFLCFLLFLYLYFYSLSRIITHVCFFNSLSAFPQCVPSELEVDYEKPILTRTETFSITICFKEPLLFIILVLKRMCIYLLFISIRTRN